MDNNNNSIWVRVWNRVNVRNVSERLMVVGVLQAECYKCHNPMLEAGARRCPECGTTFSFVAFRKNVLPRDLEHYADLTMIDLDDFMKEMNRHKAHSLFDQ